MSIPSKQSAIYSNWTMQGPDGAVLCRCGADRAEWYLERNLAEIVAEKTIRLNFEPNGQGHRDDEYYLAEKLNRCVVCGLEEGLTRHHVVPFQFRKHFPVEIKSRSSHDIVPLCVDCHEEYELVALSFTRELIIEFGAVPKQNQLTDEEKIAHRVSGFAHTIFNRVKIANGEIVSTIPDDRVIEMWRMVEEYAGRSLAHEEMESIGRELFLVSRERLQEAPTVGEQIAQKLNEVKGHREFIVRWRDHFVKTMEPKFLPTGWDIYHPGRTD